MKLGRTSENEVVLHDHGVSRRHARISARGGRHYLTDLGSANGTSFNGKPLARDTEQELRDGDRLAIGSVEFVFTALAPPPSEEATRIAASPGVRPRTSTRITRAETEQEMQAIESEDTGPHRTVTELELPSAAASVGAPTLIETPAVPAALTRPASLPPAHSREGGGLSAAERARRRRELAATLGGQLVLGWTRLSPRGKSLAGVVTGLAIVALAVMLLHAFRPDPAASRPTGPEPTQLGLTPLAGSFGLGEGVTWSTPDQKAFEVQFASPTRAVVVLHYQASDISPREVEISLNGVHQDWVPADTSTAGDRQLEQVLAAGLVKRNAPNRIVFDNTRNPPGQERWRVWNVYVEVVPVPELPVEELLAKAREEVTAARRLYELRDVGSDNLFKSWKHYRAAWLTLEALERKPDLYEDVRYALRQTSAELDQQCRKLMLDFQRSLQFQDGDRARATVEEVIRRFPTTEHRCHNLALEKAYEYELPI